MKSLLRPLGFKDYPAGNTHFSHLQWRKMKPLRGSSVAESLSACAPHIRSWGNTGQTQPGGESEGIQPRHTLPEACFVVVSPLHGDPWSCPRQWLGLPASIPALVSGASCSLLQKRLFMLVSHGRSEELAVQALVRGPVCVRVSPHS